MPIPEFKKNARMVKQARKYGVSVGDLVLLDLLHSGRCAICRKSVDLVVDHCHDTGSVRGLLCHNCNTGLGLFGDSQEVLQKAIEYLRDWVEIHHVNLGGS